MEFQEKIYLKIFILELDLVDLNLTNYSIGILYKIKIVKVSKINII